MSWLLYQLVNNPACLVVPGGAWMGSCIAERRALPRPLLVAESRSSPAKLPATVTAEFARTFRILCSVSSARGSDIRKHPAVVNRHAIDVQARKLIVPQLSQTYAQAAKSSTLNNSTQTDENITKIKCPPLKLLAPLSSKQRPNIPTAVTTSSSSQAQLLPSISSKKSTISAPQPPTTMSNAKENIKEQLSKAHCSRKVNKKKQI
ncbi:hypothetical protein TNCV_1597991 [Trichonephila clavipes]|nr:hypothetical protein TNCV_1597991 [Trichonephila clavipes]